jgi:flagellar basal-body rod protein FlgC
MEVAASGLSAERTRMNAIASNLANARTTKVDGGGPYRRVDPVFTSAPIEPGAEISSAVSLVRVQQMVQDQRDPQLVYEPGHPDANAAGYVAYPNVNVVEEMVNMMTASRAYEAGVTSIESIKSMAKSALGIAR